MKAKLIKTGKVLFIICLLLAITLVVILQWKGDFLIEKVLDRVQSQLTDSLTYSDVEVSGLSYFPCLGIQLHNPHIGRQKMPLLKGERIDVVVALWPLFRDEIQIRSIHLHETDVGIRYENGKWSYAIIKENKDIEKADAGENETSGWNTVIRKIAMDNCRIFYDDGKSQSLVMAIASGEIKGEIGARQIDADIEFTGQGMEYKSSTYVLPEPIDLQFSGHLLNDIQTGKQVWTDWKVMNEGIELQLSGSLDEQGETTVYDLRGEWKNGDPQMLRRLVPAEQSASIKDYTLSGKSKGAFTYEGASSKLKSPVLDINGSISDAEFRHSASGKPDLQVDATFVYHSNDPDFQHKSTLLIDVAKKEMLGSGFKGSFLIQNLDAPLYTISVNGNCPAQLINIVSAPELSFTEGEFDVESFELKNFRTNGNMIHTLFSNLRCSFKPNGIKGTYVNNALAFDGGYCKASGDGRIEFVVDDMQWDKLTAKHVKGDWTHAGETLEFDVAGKSCGGDIAAKGTVQTTTQRNTLRADWKVAGIEMKTLLESFSNFDQTFITSENLSGNADIWAETVMPMNGDWQVMPKEIVARCAIIIKKGQLKNLKTLEDFSDYIHLTELRDIQFNELRNYLKIEDGKVFLPVMFIQSSAINMSIAGVHSFDQTILYNMKLNAGQTIANKLKRTDFRKDIKPARKSGWINMYFVLEGTTSNVKYQQYRTAVISGFEQSAALKEQLRNYMVDRFGYDVYWLEPNEWEDVPEYK